MKSPALVALVLAALTALACGPKRPPATAAGPPPSPSATAPSPAPGPTPRVGQPGAVTEAEGEVLVSAWSEPRQLPAGGGDAQIIVRLRKRGGVPYPGVEVRLATTAGTLFSRGRVLVTEANGITRDRLSTNATARVTVNAGGTLFSFDVPVAPGS